MKPLRFFISVALLTATAATAFAAEKLDRAMVALRSGETSVYLGWRLFESDPAGRVFNVYRSTAGGEAVKLNDVPMAAGTRSLNVAQTAAIAVAEGLRQIKAFPGQPGSLTPTEQNE